MVHVIPHLPVHVIPLRPMYVTAPALAQNNRSGDRSFCADCINSGERRNSVSFMSAYAALTGNSALFHPSKTRIQIALRMLNPPLFMILKKPLRFYRISDKALVLSEIFLYHICNQKCFAFLLPRGCTLDSVLCYVSSR